MKKKILLAFGTRPEAIKMFPVFHELSRLTESFEVEICVSGQHNEMLFQVIEFFAMPVRYSLQVMQENQTIEKLTSRVIEKFSEVLVDYAPDIVLVHGDTTTTFACALSCFYKKIKCGHVEAGLRTNNKYSPFPEEMNRLLTSRLVDFHYAPTEAARNNLLHEGVEDNVIVVTGNTVIDALFHGLNKIEKAATPGIAELSKAIDFNKKLVLVTSHRRENFGDGIVNICYALRAIAEGREDVEFIFPVHLNPNVRHPVNKILCDIDNVKLIEPLSYDSFIWLMSKAYVILTDSGGIQEEAPSLGKPVLVMRETSERPEAIEAGSVKLVGSSSDTICYWLNLLLDHPPLYSEMSKAKNPYGDGRAAQRIADHLISSL